MIPWQNNDCAQRRRPALEMHYEAGEITRLLSAVGQGDNTAAERLTSFVYHELRGLAASHMRSERSGHTLQPTALVHEAFLRLMRDEQFEVHSRAQFLGIASTVMRRVLVEHARGRNARKRSGLRQRVELRDDVAGMIDAEAADLVDLDRALERLERVDPRLSRTVELRYFGGLSVEEAADVLGVSPKTVKRDWSIARAWLKGELSRGSTSDASLDQD
ncbi:MAG TPA: sigma-70 family RNA polymerase sigma factor [Bryobacteraceae bacterium]|nr:sigma-70 family RNA polymerase sigma factor [Bryobacteraceae bacterium]